MHPRVPISQSILLEIRWSLRANLGPPAGQTLQPSISSTTKTNLSPSMKYTLLSTSSFWGMVLIVAQNQTIITGTATKSTSHRLRFARSRSGISHAVNHYLVSNSSPRTMQLFCRLDMTGLLVVGRPKLCILRMESESLATDREPPSPVRPTSLTSSWLSVV